MTYQGQSDFYCVIMSRFVLDAVLTWLVAALKSKKVAELKLNFSDIKGPTLYQVFLVIVIVILAMTF